MIPYYIMIVDPLPSSKLDIKKYLDRHGITVHDDFFKENLFRIKCEHDKTCGIYNELVMLKDFRRDDSLSVKYQMNYIEDDMFVFENSHISNLIYCRMSNKKLYKQYMKEFKTRRRHWKYFALIVSRPVSQVKNKAENQLLKELEYILTQSQIEYKRIANWNTITTLRKEILKELVGIKLDIEEKKKVEMYGSGK